MNMDGHPPFPCNVGKTTSNVLVPSFHLISQLVHGCSSTQKKLSYGIWYIPIQTGWRCQTHTKQIYLSVGIINPTYICLYIFHKQWVITNHHHNYHEQLYNMFWHHLLVVENRNFWCWNFRMIPGLWEPHHLRRSFLPGKTVPIAGDSPWILMN